MISKEMLKREIDSLNENQISRLAAFVDLIKTHAQMWTKTAPTWQRVTPAERSRDFRTWVAGLPPVGPSLGDEAFDRESIYES